MEMSRFWTKLADVPLWLQVRWPYTATLFEPYKVTPTEEEQQQYRALMQEAALDPDQPLQVTAAEIDYEKGPEDGMYEEAPEKYLESLAIYRKLTGLLLCRNVLLFHCSALEMDGRAYLFTAPSGTGKSTHARLWRQVFGDRVKMINDDKPLLRLQADGSWRVYGTPYGGKDNLQNNISQTIGGIVLLERGTENKIEPVNVRDAYPRLLAQTYHDKQQPQALLRTMDLVGSLAKLPVYRLQCNISEQAVHVAYEALKGETK